MSAAHSTLRSVPGEATPATLRIPANEAAERAVLGAVLADANCFYRVVDTIAGDDFYSDANRLVFEAFRQLAGDNRDIDLLTAIDQLERSGTLAAAGGVGYVASLAEGLPDPANVEHYAAILRERAVRRRLLYLAQELVRDAAESAVPIKTTLASGIETITDLQGQLGGGAVPNPNADLAGFDRTALWRATRSAAMALVHVDVPQVRDRLAACKAETERRRKDVRDERR